MRIAAWKKISAIDYPGKISTIVFTPKCNYQCPACHAKNILCSNERIPEEEIFNYIDFTNKEKKLIDAVVLCGGEPTLQHDLIYFAEKIKERGLLVKLDTNGCEFGTLIELHESKLIDYVAMDVKGPPQIYADLIGREFLDSRDGYEKAIDIVSHFPDYEFRTTVVPVIRRNGEISFLTPEEIGETAKLIYDCTGSIEHKYFLQKFVPRKGELLNSRLESFPETPKEILEKGKKEAIKYLPNAKIR
jgi:pyruvate formate lyase activating enzyme